MKQKQQLLILLFFAAGIMTYAQIGVGTTSPTTTLDILGENHTTAPGPLVATDGVTVPRVTTDMTATPAAGSTRGQLVYSDHTSSTGFYYWDGSSWVPLSSSNKFVNGNSNTDAVFMPLASNY
mgnify:FL=1